MDFLINKFFKLWSRIKIDSEWDWEEGEENVHIDIISWHCTRSKCLGFCRRALDGRRPERIYQSCFSSLIHFMTGFTVSTFSHLWIHCIHIQSFVDSLNPHIHCIHIQSPR
jgi:hypothetical protein